MGEWFAASAATLSRYFAEPFVRNAFIVGTLIALCSSLLGVTLVLKRLSFIGDGLSHVAFGALAVTTVASVPKSANMLVILPITVLTAIIILKGGQNAKIKGDAGLAMLSVGALGVGYLLMNKFSGSANVSGDVCTTLFGSSSIMNLKTPAVIMCVVLSLLVIGVFVFFYNRIFTVTFDESFATATGTKASVYNMMIAIVTAVIIVLAMNLVGSLLISALVIFPALSAMRVFKSFKKVVVCSAAVSVFCASTGIIASILLSTPIGPTVVVADIIVFVVFYIIGLAKRG